MLRSPAARFGGGPTEQVVASFRAPEASKSFGSRGERRGERFVLPRQHTSN